MSEAIQKKDDEFAHGMACFVAFLLGIFGAAGGADDPEVGAFWGFVGGIAIGYIGGRILAALITVALRILVAVLSALFILIRILHLLGMLGS